MQVAQPVLPLKIIDELCVASSAVWAWQRVGKMHTSDSSEGLIVEQQLIDEFTIQSEPLGNGRSVRHPLHRQPVQCEHLGRGRVSHAGTLFAQPEHVGASRTTRSTDRSKLGINCRRTISELG